MKLSAGYNFKTLDFFLLIDRSLCYLDCYVYKRFIIVKKIFVLASLLAFLSGGCQTYRWAHQVKMVSFDDNLHPAQSIGNIRGESCQTTILGIPTGGPPSLEKALEKAQKALKKGQRLRYVNDMSTSSSSLNGFVYIKECIIVTGIGYK